VKHWVTDLCGTVVREDTTLGLVRRHLRRRKHHFARLAVLASRHGPGRFLWGAAERVTGRHLLKHLLVGLLRGESLAELELTADAYADELLNTLRVASVAEVLSRRPADEPLVVASASLSPIVAAVARRLGAQHVASTLEVRDGRLTGRYAEDLTGLKLRALFGAGIERPSVALSDNLTDRSLLEASQYAYVVWWRPKDRLRWGSFAATYLRGDA
jgi:phosphoserine phosphatase